MISKHRKFSISSRLRSFNHAFAGLRALIRYEHNSRIHFTAAILTIALGIILGISLIEWCILVGIIALVVVVELINSAFERLADHISLDISPTIKLVKDYCAAAVLVSSIAAVVIGVLIFLPKLLLLL